MAVGFRRSVSFPAPKTATCSPLSPRQKPAPAEKKTKSYKARSASLPCRFHPLVSRIDDAARALSQWTAAGNPLAVGRPTDGAGEWIRSGLLRLAVLLTALADLLHLPPAQDHLRCCRQCPAVDRLLDIFLRLADAFGSFRASLLNLRQLTGETHVAVRRRDPGRAAFCVRAHRQAERELGKLAVAAREAAGRPPTAEATEMEWVMMRTVTAAAAGGSAAVFGGVAAMSAGATAMVAPGTPAGRPWWVVAVLRWRWRSKKKGDGAVEGERRPAATVAAVEEEEERRLATLGRLEELKECMTTLESLTEEVFRTLVNIRVSLLNTLTPGF